MSSADSQRFLRRLASDVCLRERLSCAVGGAEDLALAEVRSLLAEAGFRFEPEDYSVAARALLNVEIRLDLDQHPVPTADSRLAGLAGTFFLPTLPGWDGR